MESTEQKKIIIRGVFAKKPTVLTVERIMVLFEKAVTRHCIPVVGSGPMRRPGKSLSSKYLINVVFPVEYCPMQRTSGFESKSVSVNDGDENWGNYMREIVRKHSAFY